MNKKQLHIFTGRSWTWKDWIAGSRIYYYLTLIEELENIKKDVEIIICNEDLIDAVKKYYSDRQIINVKFDYE